MDEKEQPGRQLTRRQFDEVIRRASELAAHEAEGGDGDLPEAEVYRIAREVGLGQAYVRRALSEVHSEVAPGGIVDRLVGPGMVRASRVVDGEPEVLAGRLDEFLVAGRLLQRVRRSSSFLQYRPAVDWVSQVSRAASGTSRKYFVASARSVEVHLEPLDEGRTLVDIEVDPGIQGEYLAGTLLGGGGAGVGAGIGVLVATVPVIPEIMALAAGVAAAGGVFTGVAALVRRAYRRKYFDVRAEVEGVLDTLERGETLEPPPASWRRWVERHFHGARRLFESALEDDGLGR
ncbi:MAG: hypothetical protein HKN71_06605 [Gemmatimonadetes bacterium]|nr:hypothetical protein [Gemmatimonadota bacterium]